MSQLTAGVHRCLVNVIVKLHLTTVTLKLGKLFYRKSYERTLISCTNEYHQTGPSWAHVWVENTWWVTRQETGDLHPHANHLPCPETLALTSLEQVLLQVTWREILNNEITLDLLGQMCVLAHRKRRGLLLENWLLPINSYITTWASGKNTVGRLTRQLCGDRGQDLPMLRKHFPRPLWCPNGRTAVSEVMEMFPTAPYCGCSPHFTLFHSLNQGLDWTGILFSAFQKLLSFTFLSSAFSPVCQGDAPSLHLWRVHVAIGTTCYYNPACGLHVCQWQHHGPAFGHTFATETHRNGNSLKIRKPFQE